MNAPAQRRRTSRRSGVSRQVGCSKFVVVLTAALAVHPAGCSPMRSRGDVIRVDAVQDTARARRLTAAGIKHLSLGDLPTASEKLLAAVDADPVYGPAHNTIGMMHYEAGRLYQAVLAFEAAMDAMPHDAGVHYNLALALEAAGRIDEAEELYYRAAEMEPDNPFHLGNLVRLKIRRGEDNEEVRAMLRRLVLIETRPDWRAWANDRLALENNPALDRGPEVPDLDEVFRRRRDDRGGRGPRVIDLSEG